MQGQGAKQAMKFNLKNRPDTGDALAKAVFDEWFEGFEKELRESLDALTDFENHYDAGRKAVLRQILGDEK